MLFWAADVSVVDSVHPYIIFKNLTKSPKVNPWLLDVFGDGDLFFGDFLVATEFLDELSSR